MTSSDSRSALPHFVGYSAYRGSSLPVHRLGRLTERSHCWGGDGSLLFPRRLSHHSTSLTPPGSSGLHFQALHPFHGLRPIVPGSAPGYPLAGMTYRRGRLRLMLRTGGLHLPKKKARPHASTPGSLRTPVGCYRGVLAPPPAGLSPASRSGHQDAPRCQDSGRLTTLVGGNREVPLPIEIVTIP